MENFYLVSQWASTLSADKAKEELENLRAKYAWLKCEESWLFVLTMAQDLPRVLNIIKLQEKQNAMLRYENEKLHGYIKANNMADEVIIDDLQKKFNIEI